MWRDLDGNSKHFFHDLLFSQISSVFVSLIASSLHVYVKSFTFFKKRASNTDRTAIEIKNQQPYMPIVIIRLVYHYGLMFAILAFPFLELDTMVIYYIIISNMIFGHTFFFIVNLIFFKQFREIVLSTCCLVS